MPWAQPGCYAGPELKQEGVGGVWIFQARITHRPDVQDPLQPQGEEIENGTRGSIQEAPLSPPQALALGWVGQGVGVAMFAGEEGASLHEPGMLGSGIHHGCVTVAARAHLLRSFT